jgi:hypothetical protein
MELQTVVKALFYRPERACQDGSGCLSNLSGLPMLLLIQSLMGYEINSLEHLILLLGLLAHRLSQTIKFRQFWCSLN